MQKCKSETEKSEATGLKNMVNQRFFCPEWSFNEAASTFFSLLNWTFRVTICTPLISLIIDFFTGFNYSTTEAELYIINWQFIFITKAASFLERVDGVSIPKWSTNYDLHSRILENGQKCTVLQKSWDIFVIYNQFIDFWNFLSQAHRCWKA